MGLLCKSSRQSAAENWPMLGYRRVVASRRLSTSPVEQPCHPTAGNRQSRVNCSWAQLLVSDGASLLPKPQQSLTINPQPRCVQSSFWSSVLHHRHCVQHRTPESLYKSNSMGRTLGPTHPEVPWTHPPRSPRSAPAVQFRPLGSLISTITQAAGGEGGGWEDLGCAADWP